MSDVFTQGPRCEFDAESITVDSTVGGKSLTASKLRKLGATAFDRTNANSAFISVEGADIRIAFGPAIILDNSTPTGHLVVAGSSFTIVGATLLDKIRFIEAQGSTPAVIHVTYFS